MISDGATCVTSSTNNDGTNNTNNDASSAITPSTRRRRASNLSAASSGRASIGSCSRNSSLKWSTQSIGGGGEKEDAVIDSSVNALVPNLLIRQLIATLQKDCELNLNYSSSHHKMGDLKEAISNYQSNGSIQRHRGALLFVDISGFTTLSQNYPVEDFKTFINEYFTKIIDLIQLFGGEVVKFAGDALYAVWTTTSSSTSIIATTINYQSLSNNENDEDLLHAINIEKCTACAIAISTECNNYQISKSYSTTTTTIRRRSSILSNDATIRRRSSILSNDDNDDGSITITNSFTTTTTYNNNSTTSRVQGEVLYKFEDKNAQYEKRGGVLNVYCGVSEGVLAGVDVVSSNRAEFFLIGAPMEGTRRRFLNCWIHCVPGKGEFQLLMYGTEEKINDP